MYKFLIYFTLFVLASPALADNFILTADGAVADLSTGLVWQGNSTKSNSGQAANELCAQNNTDDSYRWRLPTRSELSLLDSKLQSISPSVYWVNANLSLDTGLYCFADGAYFQSAEISITALVRCVSDNPLAPALEAVRAWVESWQNGDVEHYLSSYVSQFRPSHNVEHSTWEKQRRERLASSRDIAIELKTEEINSLDERLIEIVFLQDYRSRQYQDLVRKRLLLKQEHGRWLITKEEQLSSPPRQSLSAATIYYQ